MILDKVVPQSLSGYNDTHNGKEVIRTISHGRFYSMEYCVDRLACDMQKLIDFKYDEKNDCKYEFLVEKFQKNIQ